MDPMLFLPPSLAQVRRGDAVIAMPTKGLPTWRTVVEASLKARGSTPVARRLGGRSMAAYFQGDEECAAEDLLLVDTD